MYECPNCAGNLKFDIARQQLYCEHCDTAVDPYSIYKEKDAREHSTEYEVTVFTCPQCGGEILSEDNTAATFCSFCGAATILDSRISKERRPARIIPFAKTKEDCKSAYAKMMRRAVFAPKILKDQENIEKFRGIYMPYWVYSFEKSGASSFFPRTKRYRRGDYVYAEDYRIDSEIQASYEGITYDASASFDDSLSKAIGPFDLEKGKTFTPTFLSGFYADTSDVDAEVYLDDATETVVADGCERLSRTSICKTHRVTESELRCAVEPAEHNTQLAMLPVWFLSYRNGDKISYAVVNGQTGKAAAEIPVDPKKYFLGSMLLAVPLFVLLNLFFTFTPTTVLLFAVVLALCCMGIANIQVSNLLARKNGEEDQGLKFMQEKAEAEAETSVAPESATAENEKKNSRGNVSLGKGGKMMIGMLLVVIVIAFVLPRILSFVVLSGIFAFDAVPFSVLFVRILGIVIIGNILISTLKKVRSISEVSHKWGTKYKGNWKAKLPTLGKPLAGIVAALVIMIINPVSDWIFYAGAMGCLLTVLWAVVDIIRHHNELTTRKLPQFNRRGGDENA